MKPFVPKTREGPEAIIQEKIVKELKGIDWYVNNTHGNMFSMGFPDLFAAHLKYGQRWIEVKTPGAWSFTPAQQREFPKMYAAGVGIWILMDSTHKELEKLFGPANFWEIYWDWCHKIKRH